MITVVGARALPGVEVTGELYLRTSRILELPGVRELSLNVSGAFDEELDNPYTGSIDRVVATLEQAASSTQVTFVVPGAGTTGDAVVAALSPDQIASIHALAIVRPSVVLGSCRFVDALELAIAEVSSPFDRGLVPIDPTVPLIVTNWYGEQITTLAARRLRGIYGDEPLTPPSDDFELIIPAVEHLTAAASMAELEQVVARLRRPDGCPWDRDQTGQSLYPQFAEELQELGEAIESGDVANQREELGDVLFHVIAQCQLASEAGDFTFDDVLRGITAKLIRRHPHVFGDVVAETYEDVLSTWQRVKAEEKASAGPDTRKQIGE